MEIKRTTKFCTREDCFLCRHIMPEWLEVVKINRKVLAYKKSEQIFSEGDTVEGIYFILVGKAKIDMSWGDKSYILRLAGEGNIIGHRGFGLDDVYPVTATALEDTTVCFIPTELFMKLLKTNPAFHFELTFFYAEELKSTERRMKNLAHMPVKGRVAEALLQVRNAFGVDDEGRLLHKVSRKDLAAMAGTTYETVIRMLNDLACEGSISFRDKHIWIIDQETLANNCKYQHMGLTA